MKNINPKISNQVKQTKRSVRMTESAKRKSARVAASAIKRLQERYEAKNRTRKANLTKNEILAEALARKGAEMRKKYKHDKAFKSQLKESLKRSKIAKAGKKSSKLHEALVQAVKRNKTIKSTPINARKKVLAEAFNRALAKKSPAYRKKALAEAFSRVLSQKKATKPATKTSRAKTTKMLEGLYKRAEQRRNAPIVVSKPSRNTTKMLESFYKRAEIRRNKTMTEAINLESELLSKLTPIAEQNIFKFMTALKGGTFFHMGMYSIIPVSKAYKSTLRIYKVIEMGSIVSGVNYENIGTTKDFRAETGKEAGKSWYDHVPGLEHKVAVKKSNPDAKYILWDIKKGSSTNVRYYLVDIATGQVNPVTKEDVLNSNYLTASEKAKLQPKPVVGINIATGELIENKTNWRTAAFEHVFWLKQNGAATSEVGLKFEEDMDLREEDMSDIFIDANADATADLDSLLAGQAEPVNNTKESPRAFKQAEIEPEIEEDEFGFVDFPDVE